MKLKRIMILPLVLLLTHCSFRESKQRDIRDRKIKDIIDETYPGPSGYIQMGNIKKIHESILSLNVGDTLVEKYFPIEKDNEYIIANQIYKTSGGVFRIFYLIDFTEKKVLDKSSDYNDFFMPIARQILGPGRDYVLRQHVVDSYNSY